jgi:unsaturated rhamnogalacturonyl hydrolase
MKRYLSRYPPQIFYGPIPHLGMRVRFFAFALATFCFSTVCRPAISHAQERASDVAERVAQTAMQRWPQGEPSQPGAPVKWNYELGTLLNGMDALWYQTADADYYRYVKHCIDQLLSADGSIPTYRLQDHSLDDILLGRQLLLLYRVTRQPKYYTAAALLREQLSNQPRNRFDGFWHKQIYPDQMWLDGLYMAEPFYAEYAAIFQKPDVFADTTRQFVLIYEHARDPKTGLLYHAWDASKKQAWADKGTGLSSVFWARGMGWYMMALVDSLPYYSPDDPGRAKLLAILNSLAASVVRHQDQRTGLWYQVLNKPGDEGNYFESSAACMFTYALAKGVRLSYLPAHYSRNAALAWQGINQQFIKEEADGSVTFTGTVKAIGLGGTPYRDGSYSYYVSAPVVSNDAKGIGSFLLAASEMHVAPLVASGRGERAVVDAWFNSQQRANAAGQQEYFHYKWNDFSNDGFSLLGHVFRSHGVATDTLYSAPTAEKLKGAQFYIIASPDIPAKNPHPNYLQPEDARQVAQWVKLGGVLVLMANDPANGDIEHLDQLADLFGIHFNAVLSHHVVGNDHAMGRIPVAGDGPLFHNPHTFFMKDTCTISLKTPAVSLLQDKGDILMATAKYGKGTVFAVADPWIYNEYTDGRNLPPEYDNFGGAMELVSWLVKQGPRNAVPPP